MIQGGDVTPECDSEVATFSSTCSSSFSLPAPNDCWRCFIHPYIHTLSKKQQSEFVGVVSYNNIIKKAIIRTMRIVNCVLVSLSSSLLTLRANGFLLPTPKVAVSTALASATNESDDDRIRRMEMVRNLQESYYKTENGDAPVLDETTGVMENLPLWRVSWTELPGRSNVLNVHEPMYTNMFETILNRPKPWYVGHLYMPGGSKSLRSGEDRYQLKPWQDVDLQQASRTAIVGTLMKITDFRRLEDGRLCLLVHAMERFVVKDAIQNLPYSIANVQILPDYEELSVDTLEEQAVQDRARAVVKSFQYHDYEYKETPLPLSRDKYMSMADVYGSWLSDLLPFASYYLDNTLLPENTQPTEASDSPAVGVELSLESRLLDKTILQFPPGLQRNGVSSADLEAQLWNALEDYCGATGLKLPDEVLCLLPKGRSWNRVPDIWYRRVCAKYPNQRRQARLSYAAAAFLESTEMGKDLRQLWLETPTTNARLADLLDRFDMLNADLIEDFQ